MPHYVTTNNADGQAVFSDKISTETVSRAYPGSTSNAVLLSSTHNFPVDPSSEADIEQYDHDRQHGFGQGVICPLKGTAVSIVSLAPNEPSPMHRTMTLDTVIVIEGVVELHLDSGEKRTLKAGDSLVQRATMHQWFNVTPNDGWVKMVGIAVASVDPVKAGEKELSTEWKV